MAEKQNWTKEAPQGEQQIVGQKMILILTKNARMVRNDIGLVFHNGMDFCFETPFFLFKNSSIFYPFSELKTYIIS